LTYSPEQKITKAFATQFAYYCSVTQTHQFRVGSQVHQTFPSWKITCFPLSEPQTS